MVKARKDSIIEDFHGTKVADPYRWLEDPSSKETTEWVKAIGEKNDSYFSESTTREADKKRLEELWNFPKFSIPRKIKNRLFYQKNDGLQNQAVLYLKEEGQEDRIIIDPNTLSSDGTVAMTDSSFNNQADHMAYATSIHGSDSQEIRVRNILTTEDTEDHIEDVKFTNIAWAPDDSGFYYSRFPKPGSVSKEDESNFNKVYFHKLGTKQQDDTLIFEQPEEKELMFSPSISDDKKFLVMHAYHGTASENRVYVKSLEDGSDVIKLLTKQDAEYSYITNENNIFYFKTNLDAPNGKVIAINLEQPELENWQDIIPEQEDVIDGVLFINGTFITFLLHHAHHQIHLFAQNGAFLYEIDLPEIGSLSGISRNKDDHSFYFGLTSFLSPTTVYQYQLDDKKLTVFAESSIPFDTNDYETSQIFYASKDGTEIPMFLTHKKGIRLDGQNPVILYGYGGFNISMTPSFNPAILRWLEKGGIYAVANLRGGTEYGEEWHKAGILANKQNVFDDFIAAGEWLITEKYTSKGKLSIMGGSNGGLLVAACMVQRPDLFGAVICRVPVIDMLRYHKFTIGRYWIPEYGNAELKEDFPFLYAYSPLHNIKEGQTYPPVLIATAESDDRVVPAHAKKFAATLLEKANQESTVVLRLEAKAGHGAGKPTSKIIDEWVDFYDFLNKELN